MGQQNIIELNGKRYDAITGAIIGTSTAAPHPVRARTVDGFVRASKIAPMTPRAQTAPVKPVARPTAGAAKKMDVSRASGMPVKHHQPQKGKTLMRRAVHKPQAELKPHIKVQAPTEIAPASVKTVAKPLAKKLSVANVNPARAARAQAAVQSSKIQRFKQPEITRNANARHAVAPSVPLPISRPMAFTPMQRPGNAVTSAHSRPGATATVATTPAPKRSEPDIFEAAIAHATSHQQPLHRVRSRHSKLASAFAGIAALLILGGFITYLNKPGIEMQVASMKVGFQAQLPEYAPTGYAMNGGVKSENGRVSISYRSGDSSYTITQQQSDWNSQTLLENHVAANASNHQVVESQGRIIYMYNDNDASWVDGGIRYDVNGNAPLTANDIVKLASSI